MPSPALGSQEGRECFLSGPSVSLFMKALQNHTACASFNFFNARLSQRAFQVHMLEAEARRLRAHYFVPPPPAPHTHANSPALHTPANSTFGHSQTPGCGHVRAFSRLTFANSCGSFSSPPESVCSNSTHSSQGMTVNFPECLTMRLIVSISIILL